MTRLEAVLGAVLLLSTVAAPTVDRFHRGSDIEWIEGNAVFSEAVYDGSADIHASDAALRVEGPLDSNSAPSEVIVTMYRTKEHRVTASQGGAGMTVAYTNGTHVEQKRYEKATVGTSEDADGFFNLWPNASHSDSNLTLRLGQEQTPMIDPSKTGVELGTQGWQFERNFRAPVFALSQNETTERGESAAEWESGSFQALEGRGGLDLFVENATLTVRHEDGVDTFRTGSWETREGPVEGAPGTERVLAVVTFPDANLTVDLSDSRSLFLAHEPTWRIDGSVAFNSSQGELATNESKADIDRAQVRMDGSFPFRLEASGEDDYLGVVPEPHNNRKPDKLLEEPRTHAEFGGDADEVTVDGRAVATGQAPPLVEDPSLGDRVLGALLLAWVALKKLGPALVGLLGKDPLENPRREQIFETVLDRGVVHLREIHRLTDIPIGSLSYHLEVLENQGLLQSERYANYKAFFPASHGLDRETRKRLAPLADPTRRRIAETVLSAEITCQDDLAERLDLTQGAISRQISRLVEAGLIQTRRTNGETYSASPLLRSWTGNR